MIRHTWLAIAGLTLAAAPALAQEPTPAPAAAHADMATHMVCEMGALPGHMGGMQGMKSMEGMKGMEAMKGMESMRPGQPPAAAPARPAQPAQPAQPGQPAQPAQAPGHQGMQHGQPAAGPGMAGMMAGMDHTRTAHMLAEHGDEMGLALTEAQKTQMMELATSAKASCETHLKAAHTEHAAAQAALQGGDLDAYEDKLEDAAEHVIQAHVPVIRSGIEAKALLTDEQRAKLPAKAHGAHTP